MSAERLLCSRLAHECLPRSLRRARVRVPMRRTDAEAQHAIRISDWSKVEQVCEALAALAKVGQHHDAILGVPQLALDNGDGCAL
eukprot:4771994-Prymnesium_polylepis.1